MPIKNYTTEVPEEKTVGEIMSLLAGKGARSIRVDYDDHNRPAAVGFIISIQDIPIPFKLPCNFDGVFKALLAGFRNPDARRKFERKPDARPRARRIAWRIVKDWIAAQIALIEAEQASLAQVFLPYAVYGDGPAAVTVFDQFLQQVGNQKQLQKGDAA